jgi:YidC/Oxa1 family membrane protein insertase
VGQILGPIGDLFNHIFTYPIFNVLMLLYHVFGDFGLSIIVMTVIIRLVLFPLTLAQLRSMKATQAIQPQVQELNKKYEKDPRAKQEALMALYKETGVNPMAGCLPLLIQLPVLYGLFYALNGVLKNPTLHNATYTGINDLIYPFLPHFLQLPNTNLNWFTFLNPAWHISLGHPDPTHILPILAGLATFIQLRMSQPRSTAGSKDMMSQQQQLMQFIMPVFTAFIAWGFAAGLALYWTTTSVFSIVQQFFVTGWGSLLAPIPFLSGLLGGSSSGSKSSKSSGSDGKNYTGDQRKESQLLSKADKPEAQVVSGSGPVARNMRTSSHMNGSSSGRRRQRGSSASARRRGNTSNRSRG